MWEGARAGSRVLVVALSTACSFDTSGASTAGFGMSLGDGPDGSAGGEQASEGEEGEDEATTIGSGADVDGSGESGAPQCSSCGLAPPQGWQGPFAISSASPPDPARTCAQGWTEHAYAWRELHADPAMCTCSCAPAGGTCSVSATYYGDAACTDANGSGSSSGDCKDMISQGNHDYVRMVGNASGVACMPVPTVMVPPPAWTEGALLCAPPPGDPCDGGTCLPATPPGFDDARWCITATGQQGCPNAVYSQPLLMHMSVADTRTCSACTCGVQGQATCPGTVDQFSQPFCFLPAPDHPVDGACRQSGVGGANTWSFSYDGTPPAYGCSGSGSVAMGDAIAADPVMVCCTP